MKPAIGVMLNNLERDRLKAFEMAVRYGFDVVHTNAIPEAWLEGDLRDRYIEAARASGVTIACMFVGFDGQSYADIPSIHRTVGLAIPELQAHRTEVALRYSDLARELGVTALAGHLGFLPEGDCSGVVDCVQRIADYCAANGQMFNLETGQESSARMVEFLGAVKRSNVGVNFDPGNFVLYGTDDPAAAFDRLAPWVRGVHCKDGLPPLTPGTLGEEVPLGRGKADIPRLVERLHEAGYEGPLIIERESGSDPVSDILEARTYLQQAMFRAERS